MNSEALQQRHADLEQRLVNLRERIRQAETQLADWQNAEQQILGALALCRELLQAAPPLPIDNATG